MVDPGKLAERYIVERRIGIGGMGTVYSARDERLDRLVAIKLLKEELSSDPRFIERFRREARAAAALSHPNVANVFDYGESDGRPFIVMELIDGRDLSAVMREEGPLGVERTSEIAAQIARGLGHAHSAGLVHRDVKPHNVIVMEDDRVKVTDFGIARATGESTLTVTGTILGTAQYLSPEQASGETPGPPSDVYSLGIVLYEMLTGAVPFTGDSPISVALRHVRDEVPPPSTIDPKLPSEFDRLVARATAKQPEERFIDGNEFAAALAAPSAPLPPTAELTHEPDQRTAWPFATPPKWDPQRLGRTVVAVFIVLFLVALAALGYRLASSTEDIRERNRQRAEQGQTPVEEEPTATPMATFTLPDYRGGHVEEARAELAERNIEAIIQPEDCGQPADHVCEQSPEPGSTVEEGDEVTLVVSTSDDEDEEGPGKSDEEGDGQGPPEHANNDKKDDD